MGLKVTAAEVRHGESWDQTHIVEVEIDELDVQLSELEKLKAKAEHFKLLFEQQQERVIDLMEQRAEKTHVSALDNGRQATVVYGEQVLYDDEAILGALNPTQIEAVTRLKIERKKLEAAVLAGTVPAQLVADHAKVLPRKPFIRISEHRESEPEG